MLGLELWFSVGCMFIKYLILKKNHFLGGVLIILGGSWEFCLCGYVELIVVFVMLGLELWVACLLNICIKKTIIFWSVLIILGGGGEVWLGGTWRQ